MTGGHLLVASREHRVKVADLRAGESREVGMLHLGEGGWRGYTDLGDGWC